MPPKKKKSVSLKTNIQTQNNLTEEILNYQKQVKLLQKELESYKAKVITLEKEIDILKINNSEAQVRLCNPTLNIALLGRKSLKVKGINISSPGLEPKLTKGCSCKGNCSNKLCGCVRNGMSCQTVCKCGEEQCQNQDSNKENIEQIGLFKDAQNVLEKLGHLSLNQESLHASEKKSKRGMFSPFGDYNSNVSKDALHDTSSIKCEIRRRLFTQDSDELVDINNSSDEKNALHTESKYSNLQENSKNFNNSQNQSQKNISINEINKAAYSPRVSRKKSKSISPDHHVCHRKYEKGNKKMAKLKSRSISPNDNYCKNIEEKKSTLSHIEHSSQLLSIHNNPVSNNELVNNIDQVQIKVIVSPSSKVNSFSHSSASNENGSNTNYQDTLDLSLNPMIPKRQLRRSPITTAGTVIAPVENKRFSPPKKELAVVEVNWEQHQSELVMCTICKRKFFPHRIEKHKIFCKGI